ncbi:cell division protein FtsZ [Bacteroidia bacterium]|nr:cell division protein FtsZ [Bacteroidia bacterium]
MEDVLTGFDSPKEQDSIIKVIGVGGGGGNAVTHMYKEGISDVTFVLCNTDNQALVKSEVPAKLQLGKFVTEGLGSGNKPDVAKKAAEESIPDIQKMLSDGTKMVFVTAGMGGGTGTGAAPVIAKVAKGMDILTVGIVTIPFLFERKSKIMQALRGVREINKNVDALLVINNEKLREIYPDLTVMNAFKKADDTLNVAAKSIAEIITLPGHVNLDFADVNTVLKNGGVSIMSSGFGEAANRVTDAFENALHSPLLNNNNVFNAQKILFNVYSSSQKPLMMEEMDGINDFMSKFSKDIEVIWGAATDETLGEQIKVTILATGFDVESIPLMDAFTEEIKQIDEEEIKVLEGEIIKIYGAKAARSLEGEKSRPLPYLFSSLEDMDNNVIIEALINQPAYKRNIKEITAKVESVIKE